MQVLNSEIYGEGAPLILIHGLFGSCDNLKTLGRSLGTDYTIHAIDLRNHGSSFHSDTMTYQEMAEDIIDYMQHHHIEKAHFIGHSMGGKVAMQVALSSANNILSLASLDMPPIDYNLYNIEQRHNDVMEGLKGIKAKNIQSRNEADSILSKTVDNSDVRAFLLKNLRRDKNGKLLLRLNIDAIINNYTHLSNAPVGKPFLHPVLFLKGEFSDYLLPEYREPTLKLFPQARLEVIKGTTHWLHAEKPATLFKIIKHYLKSLQNQ